MKRGWTRADYVDSELADHEDRLRRLEVFMWKVVGASLAAGGVAGAVASKLFGGG